LNESYAAYFLERLNSLSIDYPPDKVFNMDETCWRLFEELRKVLADKGAETVKQRAPTSEKTSFTALGTISASGQKLPFWVLAEEKLLDPSANLAPIRVSSCNIQTADGRPKT
jgi:hypothetical protein